MNKTLYETEVDSHLRDWNARYELLKAKAANADLTAQSELHPELEALERRRRMLRHRLEELRGCNEVGWERLQAGLERNRREAADALTRLSRRLRQPA